jgi:hypothetical protein
MSVDPASQRLRSLLGRGQPPSPSKPVDPPQVDPRTPSERLRYYRDNPDAVRQELSLPPKSDPIVLGLQWNYPERNPDDQSPMDYSRGSPGEPLAISRDLLKNGHMHIRGRTRSGKSSLAITPLLAQLARPYTAYNPDGTLFKSDFQDAIFVFDLGGDLALFNFAKELAAKGRTFRFLSLEKNDDWNYFDPLQAATGEKDRLIRLAILLQQAFSLDHGLVYGGSYYSQRNLIALLNVARNLAQRTRRNSVRTDIREIARYLEEEKVKDAEEIRMIFQFLLEYSQLQPPDPLADNVINMRRALHKAEVIYFFCPTIGEAMTARQIAGLGLYTLINAAIERVRSLSDDERGTPLSHAWVFVDEFQELAGRSYASLLAQASKFGLSLIMANQTTTQLSTRDIGLADIVRDNTFAKMYFTVTGEEDIKAIQSFSKESSRILTSGSEQERSMVDFSKSRGWQESIVPTLKTDEILHTSSTDKHCFLILDDGTRHREPIRLWTDYVLDAADFRKLKHTPPPRLTVPRPEPDSAVDQEPLWKTARRQKGSPEWRQPLVALLARRRADEAIR